MTGVDRYKPLGTEGLHGGGGGVRQERVRVELYGVRLGIGGKG